MLDNAGWSQSAGVWATVLGVVTLLVGATGAFAQLQQTLNIIWEVTPRPDRGIWAMIKDRLLSFSMVLGIAFLLLVSLVISTALQALSGAIQGLVPDALLVGRILSFVLSFGVITLLFALIFKYLPDAEVSWGDVWVGAAVTALLFAIGKFLLGLYLGRSGAASAYGAAGALVLILLWIYYSAQILGLGAEFTQVYGRQFGSRIVPAENAMRVGDAGQMNGRAVDGREQK
jgi:membrane protein